VMAKVGEKGATNDHSIREELVNLPWLGKRRIGSTGFRFVRIDLEQAEREVVIQEIRAVLEVRDVPYAGSFKSNDERLSHIWEVGAWTVHLNMQDYLWDGIKRDRRYAPRVADHSDRLRAP
jgi:alpha-L-rhamnosidase